MTIFFLIITCLFVIFLFTEYIILLSIVNKIPIRILVNGTRGKSTTVLLLYKILRTSGKQVYAKTTGDEPLIHYPDGDRKKLRRIGPASILENVRLIFKWKRTRPDVVILECMALRPEIQRALSKYIFKPTDIILTNIFPDHQEVMGRLFIENVRSIASCFNEDSTLYLSAETDSQLVSAKIMSKTKIICNQFECPVILENIPSGILDTSWSLIRTMTDKLEIDPAITEKIFSSIWNDIDRKIRYHSLSHEMQVWDLFSINDIHSARQFISYLIQKYPDFSRIIFILNCREDRPLRTKSFTSFLRDEHANTEIWLIGGGRRLAAGFLKMKGVYSQSVRVFSESQLIQKIQKGFSESAMLFCIGNKKGMDRFFETLREICENERGSSLKR